MTWRTCFTVTGRGNFPLDMLRYDGAYPKDPDTVSNIEWSLEEYARGDRPVTREYTLVHKGPDKAWIPTEARWRSFGFNVLPHSVTVEKWQ